MTALASQVVLSISFSVSFLGLCSVIIFGLFPVLIIFLWHHVLCMTSFLSEFLNCFDPRFLFVYVDKLLRRYTVLIECTLCATWTHNQSVGTRMPAGLWEIRYLFHSVTCKYIYNCSI